MEIQLTQIPKIEVFTTIFQNLLVFSDQFNLQFDNERLYIQGMDTSHVSIFELSIPAAWFDKYVAPAVPATIGINAVVLSKILASREKTQEMRMLYDPAGDDDKLRIFMGCTKEAGSTTHEGGSVATHATPPPFDRAFEMPLVDIESDLLAVPEIEYEAEITVCAAKIAAVVQQLKMFNETMTIVCTEDKISLNSADNSMASMTVEIKIDEVSEYSIDEGKEVCLSYSLNYISNICKFHKIAREVQICLTAEYPMKMVYDIGGGANMKFYLAPKIGEDD